MKTDKIIKQIFASDTKAEGFLHSWFYRALNRDRELEKIAKKYGLVSRKHKTSEGYMLYLDTRDGEEIANNITDRYIKMCLQYGDVFPVKKFIFPGLSLLIDNRNSVYETIEIVVDKWYYFVSHLNDDDLIDYFNSTNKADLINEDNVDDVREAILDYLSWDFDNPYGAQGEIERMISYEIGQYIESSLKAEAKKALKQG